MRKHTARYGTVVTIFEVPMTLDWLVLHTIVLKEKFSRSLFSLISVCWSSVSVVSSRSDESDVKVIDIDTSFCVSIKILIIKRFEPLSFDQK